MWSREADKLAQKRWQSRLALGARLVARLTSRSFRGRSCGFSARLGGGAQLAMWACWRAARLQSAGARRRDRRAAHTHISGERRKRTRGLEGRATSGRNLCEFESIARVGRSHSPSRVRCKRPARSSPSEVQYYRRAKLLKPASAARLLARCVRAPASVRASVSARVRPGCVRVLVRLRSKLAFVDGDVLQLFVCWKRALDAAELEARALHKEKSFDSLACSARLPARPPAHPHV